MALAIDYSAAERDTWRAARDYLRQEIRDQAALRRPRKMATRRGEYAQSSLYFEGMTLRSLYVLYGLHRGKTWSQVESGRVERDPRLRWFLRLAWSHMAKAVGTPRAPEAIEDWL